MASGGLRLAMTACLLAALCGSAFAQTCGGRPPNVVVIMVDDLGFHDLSIQREIYGDLNNTDVYSPNIDKLMNDGALFTESYSVAGFCSPARAGFITGIHPYHSGHQVNPVRDPRDRAAGLPLHLTTIPETLKTMGYVSGMFGKWHLGVHAEAHVNNRGFDYFMGFLGSGFEYFEYARRFKGAFEYIFKQWQVFTGVKYLTDDFTDESINFMRKNRDNPFFVFLAYNAVHSPYDYLESDVDPWVSEDRVPHVAMIKAVDRGVGKIMETLEQWKLDKCTMVIFTNDNGGHENGAVNLPLAQFKGKVWEGGVRVVASYTFPGVIEPGQRIGGEKLVSLLDMYPTIEEVAGVPMRNRNKAVEGLNLMPHMTMVGRSGPANTGPTQPIINRNPARATVRVGKWKLFLDVKNTPRPIMLFDLEADIGESNDVRKQNRDVADELTQLFIEWDKKTVPRAFQQKSRENPVKIRWEKTPTRRVRLGTTETFEAIITHDMDRRMDDIHWEVFKPSATFRANYNVLPMRKDLLDISLPNPEETQLTFKKTGAWIVRINARSGDFLQWADYEVQVV